MTRLLLTASALAAALALAAGSRHAPAGDAPPGLPDDPPWVCKSEPDAGTKPKPHGLLMVADRVPARPCTQGG